MWNLNLSCSEDYKNVAQLAVQQYPQLACSSRNTVVSGTSGVISLDLLSSIFVTSLFEPLSGICCKVTEGGDKESQAVYLAKAKERI